MAQKWRPCAVLAIMCESLPTSIFRGAGIGYYMRPFLGSQEKAHAALGTLVLVFGILQVLAAIFRPDKVRVTLNSCSDAVSNAANMFFREVWCAHALLASCHVMHANVCSIVYAGAQTAAFVGAAAPQQRPVVGYCHRGAQDIPVCRSNTCHITCCSHARQAKNVVCCR
jgi:hypothetical protein